jgi:hypothetical protein
MSLPASNETEDADLCIGRNEITIGLCSSTSTRAEASAGSRNVTDLSRWPSLVLIKECISGSAGSM